MHLKAICFDLFGVRVFLFVYTHEEILHINDDT